MGKDDKCCVPFCGNRRKLKRSLSYFRIPQNPVQRVAWLDVICKDPASIAANDRICSVHFVSGKPSPFSQNVDWKPTLCMEGTEGEKVDEVQMFMAQPQSLPPQPLSHAPLQSPNQVPNQFSPQASMQTPYENQIMSPTQDITKKVLTKVSKHSLEEDKQAFAKQLLGPLQKENMTFPPGPAVKPVPVSVPQIKKEPVVSPAPTNRSFPPKPPPVLTQSETYSSVLNNEKLPSKEALQEHFRYHGNGQGFDSMLSPQTKVKEELEMPLPTPIPPMPPVLTPIPAPAPAPAPMVAQTPVAAPPSVDRSLPPVLTKLENYSCVLCNEKLPSKEALQNHFRCHANGEGFNPVRVMDKPVGSVGVGNNSATPASGSGIETWTCDICSRVFTSKSSYLTHHMRYHPQETGHFCPHCGRMFPLRVDRDRHLLSHPDNGPYTSIPCSVCQANFYNNEALAYHMQNHQKVQEITSRVNDTADYIDDIRPSKRLRLDSMGEPQFCFYCPWCGKEYIQRYNLESHVRKMHQTMAKAERLFYCETCDSTFYNQSALMQHNFGHQQNHQGLLVSAADVCRGITKGNRIDRHYSPMAELDDEVNLLNQIFPLATSNTQQPASLSASATPSLLEAKSVWPDWMNALPAELLRAIKQEPSTLESAPAGVQTLTSSNSTSLPIKSPLGGEGPPTTGLVQPPDTKLDGIPDGVAAYPCHECGGSFPTLVAMRQHRCVPGNDNHMIKKEARCELTCGVCSSSFSSDSELADHLLTHEVYLCSDCGEELPNKTAYLEHQNQHANGELRIPLNMFLPENSMLKKATLGRPLKSASGKKPIEPSPERKQKPVESTSDVFVKTENTSPEKEKVKEKSNSGNEANEGDEQFVCGLCDQHFPDQASLEVHFREMGDHASHNSRFSVTCNICGLSFTVEAFKKHTHTQPNNVQRTANAPRSIPIKCGICQENFATKEEIDIHFASHPETARDASRRSFLCNVCVAEDPALALLASFSTLRELYDHHARQHPQMSSNYQCRLCGMRFFEQWDLASHFAKHLPENIRNQCQVVFKNGQLKATFVCERCGQVFNYEVHLANHLRNNTCLKWACHICGRGNRSAKHRNQHIREHHPADGLRYVCGIGDCKHRQCFTKRTQVYTHIRATHPDVLKKAESSGKELLNEDLDMYVIVEAANGPRKEENTDKKSEVNSNDNGIKGDPAKVQISNTISSEDTNQVKTS